MTCQAISRPPDIMMPIPSELFQGLPGAERMLQGLKDEMSGHHSIAACLVRIARPRLIGAGIISASPPRDDGAELELYQLLSASEGLQSYSRYKAIMRELVSFEHALDHRLSAEC